MKFDCVIITYDLETGGLKPTENAVAEIACFPFQTENLSDLESYNSLIRPYSDVYTYTEGALKANGLTMNKIKSGEDSKKVIGELCEYFTKYKRGRNLPILAGHNIQKFDNLFLEELFKFHKKDLWKFVNKDFFIDTMWWARLKWFESSNYKLGTCCDNANIELIDAHRAVNDTIANKDLAKDFIKSLRGNGDSLITEKRYRDSFEF